jgi:PAS domain S-box-containing protein
VLKHLSTQALFDALPDAAVVLDNTGRIRSMNRSAYLLFQYEMGEILGHPIEVLIPARFRIRHIADRENLMRGGFLEGWGPHRKLMALRKDGSEFHVLVKVSTILIDRVNWLMCCVRDVSLMEEQNQKVWELQQHFQSLDWILKAGAALAPETKLDPSSMNVIYEHIAAYCLNASYDPVQMMSVKDLIQETRTRAHPLMERLAADLIVEEFRADVAIVISPSLLKMALLAFIKLCADAVAPLGERWVKIGFEFYEARVMISLTDSAYSILDDSIQKCETEYSVGISLLRYSGGELFTSGSSESRFCLSVPARTGSA